MRRQRVGRPAGPGIRRNADCRGRHGAHLPADRLRAVLRRIGRHATGDPRAARRADQPRLGPCAAQAFLPQLRLRTASRGRRRRHRPLAGSAAQRADRSLVQDAQRRERDVPARAGAARGADVSGPLAMERHPVAGRAAATRRQTRAAAHAALSQRRPAGRRLSRKQSAAWRTTTAMSRFPTIRWSARRCTTACPRRWTSTP